MYLTYIANFSREAKYSYAAIAGVICPSTPSLHKLGQVWIHEKL
jgi:hypothetical protein